MHRADQPTEADIGHQILHRCVSFGDSWLVVKGHCKPACKLDEEAGQGDATQAVKDVDVWGDILCGDVISDRLDLKALVEPLVNGVAFGVGRGR